MTESGEERRREREELMTKFERADLLVLVCDV